jgi:hypothetical protein
MRPIAIRIRKQLSSRAELLKKRPEFFYLAITGGADTLTLENCAQSSSIKKMTSEMRKSNRQYISPAEQATWALTLFFGVGGMLLGLLSVSWLLFFSFYSIWFSDVALWVLLGALGIFLAVYSYWNWKNFCFYRAYLERKWIAGAIAASLLTAGILWGADVFYYPGAWIPSIDRHHLWLDGNFIWMSVAALYLLNGLFLPLAVCIRKKRNWLGAICAAICGMSAIVSGTLCLGMISNPFKYYSLSESCDWESPELVFPLAIEWLAVAAFALAAAASVLRTIFYSRMSGVPFRPKLLHAIGRGAVVWLTFLVIFSGGSFIGNVYLMRQLLRSPEYREMENFRQGNKERLAVEWKTFDPLLSPLFILDFSSRLAEFKNEAERRKAEQWIKQFPELTAAADSLAAMATPIPFYLSSEGYYNKKTWQAVQLGRIARLQTLRLLIALKSRDHAEAIRLWRLLWNFTITQSDFVACAAPEYPALIADEYLNSTELLMNSPALSKAELRQFQQTLPELTDALQRHRKLSQYGGQFARATAIRRLMDSKVDGIHIRHWSRVIPGLWLVVNSGYCAALTTPVAAIDGMNNPVLLIQRGHALEEAVAFLLGNPTGGEPMVRDGVVSRNYLYLRNDGASPLALENEKFSETRSYRQFGPDEGGDIILLEKGRTD